MFEMFEIKQHFESPSLSLAQLKTKIEKEIDQQLSGISLPVKASIAITAGSRGISNIAFILKVIVETLKERELSPFLVPAMGSHGGATHAHQANKVNY
jgi:hypothetical protein